MENIWVIVPWECETQTLMEKDYAERLPLGHGVVFLLCWVIRGIMDLKYHKDWTILPCFYCNISINWCGTLWKVKLKMIHLEHNFPLVRHRTSLIMVQTDFLDDTQREGAGNQSPLFVTFLLIRVRAISLCVLLYIVYHIYKLYIKSIEVSMSIM